MLRRSRQSDHWRRPAPSAPAGTWADALKQTCGEHDVEPTRLEHRPYFAPDWVPLLRYRHVFFRPSDNGSLSAEVTRG